MGGLVPLIALYYGSAHLGYALKFAGPIAAIVWLPAGVGIAFLYLAGVQFWPGVVIGDLLVNNYSALPFGAAVGQTFGNLLEVVGAALLIHRLAGRRSLQGSVDGLACLVVAIAIGTAISATVGSLSLRLWHVQTGTLPVVWRTWWLGDFSGALLVVPLALAWRRPLNARLWHQRPLEAMLAMAAVVVSSEIAFRSTRPLPYIVFPALIWTALRLGPRGATLAAAVAAGFAVWATTHYIGPFHVHTLARSVLETQLFIVVASLSALCLAAVVSEREQFAERLWESRARLVRAAETERRRLQDNLHDGAQQRLTALMGRLGLAAEQTDRTPAATEAVLEMAQSQLELAIAELRDLAHGNHPVVLAEQGLGAAMRHMTERSSTRIELMELPSVRVSEATEAAGYYVLAEAVANAQKHASASVVRLGAGVSGGDLRVEVVDDGVGGALESRGNGLQGLRDRVEALGGRFDVESNLGRGTRVTALIPVTAPRQHSA